MKFLVTGAAGFIGANAALHFAEKGHEVIAFDNLLRSSLYEDVPRDQNLPLLEQENIDYWRGDVRDFHTLNLAIEGVDRVIHAAGQTSVPTSIDRTLEDFYINAGGTVSVLQACREEGRERGKKLKVCLMSTNKVYGSKVNDYVTGETDTRYVLGKPYKNGIPETFGIDQNNHVPYGASMSARDIYGQTFNERGWVDVSVFRGSCIYGPNQFGVRQQGWLSWFTRATLEEKAITVLGDGKQVRDVTYIDDLLRAMEIVLLEEGEPGVYNIGGGPDNSLSVREGLTLISELTGEQQQLERGPWRENDQRVYISDIEKAEKNLGWIPRTGYEKGVEKVVKDFQERIGD